MPISKTSKVKSFGDVPVRSIFAYTTTLYSKASYTRHFGEEYPQESYFIKTNFNTAMTLDKSITILMDEPDIKVTICKYDRETFLH